MFKKIAKNEGFSLIELLIYIGIIGVVSGMLVGILSTVTKTQVQESAQNDVSDQLNFVMSTVQRLVRDSSLIQLNSGVASSTLTLRMSTLANDPTVIYLSNGQVYVQQGTGAAQSITSDKVNVDSLQFKKLSQPPGRDIVQVDLSMSEVQPAAGQTISRALRSAFARVNAATFDSDLLPNIDNSYNVGSGPSNRWKSINTLTISLPSTTDGATGIVFKGGLPFIHDFSPSGSTGQNTFVGVNAGNFTMNDTGWSGYSSWNTAIGYNSMNANTNGNYNTAVGTGSLASNTTGFQNTAIGDFSLGANTTGNHNTAIGQAALGTNTTNIQNTAIGFYALKSNTADSNNAFGMASLLGNTAGTLNSAFGNSSLQSNSTGSYNSAFGNNSGFGDGTNSNNKTTVDNYATFIGYNASRDASVASSTALTNITAIGANAHVATNNSIVLGGTGTYAVNVGIGTASPGENLEVDGADTTVRVRNMNDSVGGFIGNTWASLQLGMYNPSASTVGVLTAGSKMSFFGMNTSGAVGSLTNSYGSPVFRNQLDDGSGNVVLSGGRIEGVGTPTASTDAATKAYVDAAISGGSLSVYASDGTTLLGKYLGSLYTGMHDMETQNMSNVAGYTTSWNHNELDYFKQVNNMCDLTLYLNGSGIPTRFRSFDCDTTPASRWYFKTTNCTWGTGNPAYIPSTGIKSYVYNDGTTNYCYNFSRNSSLVFANVPNGNNYYACSPTLGSNTYGSYRDSGGSCITSSGTINPSYTLDPGYNDSQYTSPCGNGACIIK